MIETIEISNCNAQVFSKINTSLPGTKHAIETNSLKLFCRKMDETINLNTSAFLGKVLSITCMNLDCPLRKPNITKPDASAEGTLPGQI